MENVFLVLYDLNLRFKIFIIEYKLTNLFLMLFLSIPLIILFPLLSSFTTGLLTKFIGNKGANICSITYISINVLINSYLIWQALTMETIYFSISFGNWILSDVFCIEWNFLFDRFNLSMLFVVNSVSWAVHLYSINYMCEDPHLPRFLSYVSLFTFFMIILIIGNNFLLLFLGWEGVGLCSYLLINFWFTRSNANKSAMKALIINRIGDFGLTLGLINLFYIVKSLDFSIVFSIAPLFFLKTITLWGFEIYLGTLIGILLFIGVMGKSAQLGLHTWLPDAMEGPTPVSALIHAATMVTAGVLLIIKCSPLFEYIPAVLVIMILIGALTSFFSATIALVQNDIKKIIAYSTCSQLGYMIFTCGLSNYHVSFFHLANHAFFKALLFLTAGSVIHALANNQDMRKYGAITFLLPLSSITITIGSVALAGTPFLSGFYSKDLILELAFSHYTIPGVYAYILGLITAILTTVYSYRLFFLTFITNAHHFKNNLYKIHDAPILMGISLILLSLGSILLGYFAKDFFIGLGVDFWHQSIFIHPYHHIQNEAEFIPQIYKILPFLYSLFFIFIINFIYEWNILINISFVNKLYKFLTYKWYFDIIYNTYIVKIICMKAYHITFKSFDKGLLEIVGPTKLNTLFYKKAFNLQLKMNGQIHDYGNFMLFFWLIGISILYYVSIFV